MRIFKTLPIFLLLLPVTASHLSAGGCVDITGEASTILDLESYEGTATLDIAGRPHTLEVVGVNLGFVDTEEDGTVHAVTATDWRFQGRGGTFTTFEDARLDPTDVPGVFSYVGRSRLETGRGRYDCGQLVLQGEIDFDAGVGDFPIIRGKLCRCQGAGRSERPGDD